MLRKARVQQRPPGWDLRPTDPHTWDSKHTRGSYPPMYVLLLGIILHAGAKRKAKTIGTISSPEQALVTRNGIEAATRTNSDEDTDRNNSMENGGAGYDRDRRHAERIARALDGVEDDDEEDGDDLDFDDDAFNPRQDESLL